MLQYEAILWDTFLTIKLKSPALKIVDVIVELFQLLQMRLNFFDSFARSDQLRAECNNKVNINPITVNNFASLFNCTPVGRASDSLMAPT